MTWVGFFGARPHRFHPLDSVGRSFELSLELSCHYERLQGADIPWACKG